jgi:hypothetical protein
MPVAPGRNKLVTTKYGIGAKRDRGGLTTAQLVAELYPTRRARDASTRPPRRAASDLTLGGE